MRDLSYQLYCSRNFPPLSDTLRMVAQAGYAQVEGYSALYASAPALATLREGLAANGLAMPTGHFGFDMVRDTPGQVIEIAKALGLSAVFVPYLAAGDRPEDAAGWAAFGRALAEAGKPLRDAGLTFGWHNHEFEFADLGGDDLPLDLILGASDDLALELDLAWVAVAGHAPVDWVQKYSGRIAAAHLKDIAPKGTHADEDGWADVGHGTMEWPAIMAALEDASVRYLIVEHDNPSDDRRFAERSIASVRAF